ncbi:glycosyltransferase family 4 protein [Ferrimicrobium sp.]|uniref:glycosyltransferase family 4 protein n=1 Tax=Ferrimicrobium sp. TaxID=2926050 RepID=UPI002615AF51|nr:glycosyltransferase family 4 protein [Ferrimicrobium sp.]
MRILIFNWRDLTHPKAGGAEVYTDAVARAWISQGHQVTLFTSAVEGHSGDEVSQGGYRIIRRGGRLGVYREARRFWKSEGQGHFDLVIDEVNTKPFGCPKWVSGVPVVALIHQVAREIWFYETPFPIAVIGRYLMEPHWLRAYADTLTVTVSKSSKESLEGYGLHRVHVVAEGMEKSRYLGNSAAEKESVLTLLFVGRLSANKRPDEAIEAFRIVKRRIPEARLWIVGTGPMMSKLVAAAPPGVEFLGRISEVEKVGRLRRAHALLVTSVREGWGLVVTEAAACGTPSFGYNVAGLRDSIVSSGGVLTDRLPSLLASAIVDVVPDLLEGGMAVAPGGVLEWEQVASKILSLVLGGGTGGPVAQLGTHSRTDSPATEIDADCT